MLSLLNRRATSLLLRPRSSLFPLHNAALSSLNKKGLLTEIDRNLQRAVKHVTKRSSRVARLRSELDEGSATAADELLEAEPSLLEAETRRAALQALDSDARSTKGFGAESTAGMPSLLAAVG